MEPIYTKNYLITDGMCDRFCRLKLSQLLTIGQEVAGKHSELLDLSYDFLASKGLFWAVTRHRVEITRLPTIGETIRVETWPMPPTKVAFPRSIIAYDEAGKEIFRSISLWVLMDLEKRSMIVPGKSGIALPGTLRGDELTAPGSLAYHLMGSRESRRVRYTDLDRNGHMNNTRYLEWVDDLLPSDFHRDHSPKAFTVCYLNESREGDTLLLSFAPLLTVPAFGAAGVFWTTSLLAALVDSVFVVMQRYNRPRFLRVLEKERGRHGQAGGPASGGRGRGPGKH